MKDAVFEREGGSLGAGWEHRMTGKLGLEVEGTKHDAGKPDLSLLPRCFLDEVARAMQYGQGKYGRYNYLGGFKVHRLIASAARHLFAYAGGEDLDPESGVSHLGHLGANVLMMIHCQQVGTLDDDRYTPPAR